MPSVLNAFPYPWHVAEAQQLHVVLSQIYPAPQGALLIAQKAGVDTGFIFAQQAPVYLWKDILDQAAVSGLIRDLVQTVYDTVGERNPNRLFLDALLKDQQPPVEGVPRNDQGAPLFIHDNDDISEPEALLYHDDLTIQIGRVPSLIATLQRLVELAPSVCKLSIGYHGRSGQGTGFRIGPDLLLTNWHVLHHEDFGGRATAVSAQFGFEDDGADGLLTPTFIPCDVASIVADGDDDWGVIRTQQPLKDEWPIVDLTKAAAPAIGDAAFIIQHPGGDRKRVGFVRNQISSADDRVVHYLTDTQEGSSGAPVFNAEGRIIALHRAGGRPQVVLGRTPAKKNEGIRISRVVAGLNDNGIDLS
jgi:hypothetical protein